MGKNHWKILHPSEKARLDSLLDQWLEARIHEDAIIYGQEEEKSPELDSILLTINPSPEIEVEDFVAKVAAFSDGCKIFQ